MVIGVIDEAIVGVNNVLEIKFFQKSTDDLTLYRRRIIMKHNMKKFGRKDYEKYLA